jgi:hypothetical protein
MDFQTRFAIFTAVGVASFSAGLSLTTACQRHEALPETVNIRPALPTETKPKAPAAQQMTTKPGEPEPARASTAEPRAEKKSLAVGKVAVRRLVVTHAVRDREPIAPAELVTGVPVLAFVELANEDALERNVVVTFERDGRPAVGHVRLHVPAGSPRFRTWARTHNLGESGTWEAVVRGDDGKELGRQPFELLSMLDPA